MDMSQSLQDLLSSDKFDNPPPPDFPCTPPNANVNGETITYSYSAGITQDNDEDQKSKPSSIASQQDGDSIAYSECTKLYIVGDFINVLEKMESLGKFIEPGVLLSVDVDDLSALSFSSIEKAKKWDTLFFKTIISMDITELSKSHKDTLISLYDLVFLYTNTLFHAIVQDSVKQSLSGNKQVTKFTIEYIFGLIQAYYVLTFNATTNYQQLKDFSKIVQGYIKYTSKSDLTESQDDDTFIYYLYKMCEFYIFELEINGLHKVPNKGLYHDLISSNMGASNVAGYLKGTKYESAILEKLEKKSDDTTANTKAGSAFGSTKLKRKDTKSGAHFKLHSVSPIRYSHTREHDIDRGIVDESEPLETKKNKDNNVLKKLNYTVSLIQDKLLNYSNNAKSFYSRMSALNKTVFNSSILAFWFISAQLIGVLFYIFGKYE
ncbi:hypothetical protein ACO0QE_003207 [Hanseniaspora vineae]